MRRFWLASLWLILGGALLATAYLLINTTFMFYDDEGYLLLTYKNFLAGGKLYDEIFSQYGPWPYVYHQLVTLILHQPLTHMLGRNLTAVHWVLCAVFCGMIVQQITRQIITAFCTTLVTFGFLWQMGSEPSHPGSHIAALLAATTFAVLLLQKTARWKWLGAVLGVTGALLILTKINIGLLFIAGVGVGALRLTSWPGRWLRPAEILATAGLLILPWGLMGKNLDQSWVLNFAIQFSAAAAGLLWITPPAIVGRPIPPRTWAMTSATFLFILVIVTAIVCAQGTSLHALLQSVLLNPLRHPGSFMFGFTWLPHVWPVAIVCWLVTLRAGWEIRQSQVVSRRTRLVVISLRLITLLFFMLNAATWLTIWGVTGFTNFCLPLLPIFLIPVACAASDKNHLGALLAAGIALPQVLHAFPVAGSQMGWGTFLLIPIMIIGLNDTWLALGREAPRTGSWLPRVGGIALLMVGTWQFELLATNGYQRYTSSKPLGLPGAEDIRLDGPARLTLRILTTNAAVHADQLFSQPGMFSFNLWSGVPTPTRQNATHWFWLLDKPAQTSIEEKLRTTPRTAILIYHDLNEMLEHTNVPTHSALTAYIEENYRPIFDANRESLHSINLFMPIGSRAVPFSRIDIRGLNAPVIGEKFPFIIQSNIVLNGQPASIQLCSTYAPWKILTDFTRRGERMELAPITAQGDGTGPPINLPVSRPVHGLYRLTIFLSEIPKMGFPQSSALTIVDPEGTVLSESVL